MKYQIPPQIRNIILVQCRSIKKHIAYVIWGIEPRELQSKNNKPKLDLEWDVTTSETKAQSKFIVWSLMGKMEEKQRRSSDGSLV